MGCKIGVISMMIVVLCVKVQGQRPGLLGNNEDGLSKELQRLGIKELPNGLLGTLKDLPKEPEKELPNGLLNDAQKKELEDIMELSRNKTARYLFIKKLCMQKIGNYVMTDGLDCLLSIDSSGHSPNQYCNVANKIFKITSEDVKKVFPTTSEDADRFLNAPSEDTADALSKINTAMAMSSQPAVYNVFLKQLSVVLDSEPKELCGHF